MQLFVSPKSNDQSIDEDHANLYSQSDEYLPTPLKGASLSKLNNFIENTNGRDVSPVRSQLHCPLEEVSDSTRRYFKRKSMQTCLTTLECIAPGQSSDLFELISKSTTAETTFADDKDIVGRLITLYNSASSRVTQLEILSLFVQDYSKAQLKEMIPGITKWRIDEARRHAALYGPGTSKEVTKAHRARMDPVKVDHFIDFISQPHFLQDVAFGTRIIKLSDGTTLEIPNVIRTVTSSRLVNLYIRSCHEKGFEPLGRSTLFSVLKVRVFSNVNNSKSSNEIYMLFSSVLITAFYIYLRQYT